MKILVSACLLGLNCKYNGENNLNTECLDLLKKHQLVPVCPEQLGGLCTPRAASEIIDGTGESVLEGLSKVVDKEGIDETAGFLQGAFETLKLYNTFECELAVLKARSPSCGRGKIYDGTFSGTTRAGNGVTVELLLRNGIKVLTEEELKNSLY